MEYKFKARLIGKKVYGFKLNDDKTELRLKLDDGYCIIYAHDDCGYSSWFEGITGDEALEGGAEILEVNLINVGEVANKDPEDTDSVTEQYGLKFKTTNGYCDMDMRNESNGYYGGFISLGPDEYSYETCETTVYPK